MESTASNFPGYFTSSEGNNGSRAVEASFATSRAEHTSALLAQTAARDVTEVIGYSSKDNVIALLDKHYHALRETQQSFKELERQVANNRELTLALQLDQKNAEIRALDRASQASVNDSILSLLKSIAKTA